MPAEDTLIGLIELEAHEGRSLASVLESLVTTDTEGPVLCRVRREAPDSTVPANLPQLTESLESEYSALQKRLRGVL